MTSCSDLNARRWRGLIPDDAEMVGGLAAFRKQFEPLRTLLVGGDGIPLEEFLSTPVVHWLEK
jgi:hypothetical protein